MQSLVIDSVMMMLVLSAIPMVGVACAAGLVALIQAATQVQEQSVTHLARLLAFIGIVIVAGRWAGGEIVSLFERALAMLSFVEGGGI